MSNSRGGYLGFIGLVVALAAPGCSSSGNSKAVTPRFDLAATKSNDFFDFPFPSDLRLDDDGTPNIENYPDASGGDLLASLFDVADKRRGFPVIPITYFRFDGELAPMRIDRAIPANPSSTILIIDVDADSPRQGSFYPAVATTLPDEKNWSPGYVLAVAPYPGIILDPDTQYAVVVTTALRAADGRPIRRAPKIAELARDKVPDDANGKALADNYAPLWPILDSVGVARERVATAAVFTTGDVVADLAQLADRASEKYSVALENIRIDATDGADHDGFCEVLASVEMPQFQQGTPPFNNDGDLVIDANGVPEVQRSETVPIVLTIPTTTMPAGGYPLMTYFHGSGGVPSQLVDRGRKTPTQPDSIPGTGPGFVVAGHGIAGAAAAMPLSPDRLPGASDIEYINFSNLGAFPHVFQQGVIEQRLLLDALLALELPAGSLESCGIDGAVRFDSAKVVASGQSMGGMYTNMIAATDRRIGAAVPTGAGGYWHRMLLGTEVIEGADDLLALLFKTDLDELTFAQPGLALLSLAWEGAEPMVFMNRVAAYPLPGHSPRPSYQPIGYGDVYFPTYIFDSAVLAYRNQLAGEIVWSETEEVLEVAGITPRVSYPVADNRISSTGARYTGVAVQYASDGIQNAHYIFAQLDEVKYQYGCFLATFAAGAAVVPAPAPLGSPCPTK